MWGTVYAEYDIGILKDTNDSIMLNFDVNVRGDEPTYEDEWKIKVIGMNSLGTIVWEEEDNEESGIAT